MFYHSPLLRRGIARLRANIRAGIGHDVQTSIEPISTEQTLVFFTRLIFHPGLPNRSSRTADLARKPAQPNLRATFHASRIRPRSRTSRRRHPRLPECPQAPAELGRGLVVPGHAELRRRPLRRGYSRPAEPGGVESADGPGSGFPGIIRI